MNNNNNKNTSYNLKDLINDIILTLFGKFQTEIRKYDIMIIPSFAKGTIVQNSYCMWVLLEMIQPSPRAFVPKSRLSNFIHYITPCIIIRSYSSTCFKIYKKQIWWLQLFFHPARLLNAFHLCTIKVNKWLNKINDFIRQNYLASFCDKVFDFISLVLVIDVSNTSCNHYS